MLLLLPLLHAQRLLRLHVCAEAQRRLLVSGDMCDQLAVCKDLPWIQHPGLQKFRLRLRRQIQAARQTAAVALHREGHGELQRADAALPVGGVQHRYPDRAGELRLSVPQLPAVEIDLSISLDDPRDIWTVVRHDGLSRLLLCQYQLTACLIGIQACFFQIQFHQEPFLSRQFDPDISL